MYLTLTGHLNLDQPHCKRSIATCDLRLLYWTVQVQIMICEKCSVRVSSFEQLYSNKQNTPIKQYTLLKITTLKNLKTIIVKNYKNINSRESYSCKCIQTGIIFKGDLTLLLVSSGILPGNAIPLHVAFAYIFFCSLISSSLHTPIYSSPPW